jgi:hypothetical protein
MGFASLYPSFGPIRCRSISSSLVLTSGLARFAEIMANHRVMTGWLAIIRSIGGFFAGWGASLFMAWLGLSQLWRWSTTGELVASFRGMDNVTRWKLVTYESHPLDFVSAFVVYAIVATAGVSYCVMPYLAIRGWWRRPQGNSKDR